MAFPRVASIRSTQAATGAATVLTLPAGVMAGDLLVCFAISRVVTTAITVSVGTWTTVSTDSSTTYSRIFARIADGTSADQITLNKANDDWCAIILRIVDHGVTTIASDIKVGTPAGGTSTTADPPSLDAGSTDDWLWCAMAGCQLATTGASITGVPGSYTEQYRNKSASSTTSVAMGVATRALNGQTQNPGTFAISTSRAWRAQTIAIKPGTARTGARIDECPLVSFNVNDICTSASFTPVANSVLVAVCAIGNSDGAQTTTGVITDSLSSADWVKLDEYQSAVGNGRIQIWAQDIGASPSARTVTLTSGPTNGWSTNLALYCCLGTSPAASILGATDHATANAESSTISVSADGSLVFCAFSDSNVAGVATPGTNMMLDIAVSDASNGEKHAIEHAAAVQNTGSFTYSVGTITGNLSSFAAWELKAASTGVTGTVARTLDSTTAAVAGAVVNAYTGTVARTLNATTCAAAGTNTLPPITGTVARTLDSTTCVASGSRTIPNFTGTVARTMDATTCVASGSRTVPDFTGTLARTLDSSTVVAAGSTTAPTIFGNPDQQGTSAGGLTGTLTATKYTLSEAALVRGLHYYAREDGNVKGAIYADNAGTPGSLIVANNTGTTVLRLQWTTVDVADTILAAGDYWIGFLEDEDSMRAFKAGGTNQAAYKTAQGYAGGMPSSWTPTAYQNNDYVAFADYTPAIVGTVTRTLDPTTCVAAGSRTVPAFTGTVVRTLDATTAVASGSRSVPDFTGTVARTLNATTCVAAGTRTVPAFTGTLARTLDSATASAAGTNTVPPITGTVIRTLDAVACVAVGLAAGQLPPLVPPFVAIIVGYETFTADLTHTTTVVTVTTTSTVSSTARTSTVNQTLVGVT